MTGSTDIIDRLAARVAGDDLDGVHVTYTVAGGAPGETVSDDELRISDTGAVFARARAATAGIQRDEILETSQRRQLLLAVSKGLRDLIPASEARFVPDTVVGRVAVGVDGQEAQFYFLPDAAQARQHGKPLSARGARAVAALDRLHKSLLVPGGGR